MAYSLNTNIAALQAENGLRITGNFQTQTIQQISSGLRISQAGDDVVGMAVANLDRSDQAVLTQGISNANNGLSQLQIIDSGLQNISQMLDRARSLAAQSVTGTFTGDRNTLNQEFQDLLSEIDREAQQIGLNTGGLLAKNFSVYIGGGQTGVNTSTNEAVNVNLSQAVVDSAGLGLTVVQAVGASAVDIGDTSGSGPGGASQSVKNLIADPANQASEATAGSTDFYFQGPGFSGANRVKVTVNLAGVTDTSTLVNAVNNALQNVGGANAAAFQQAGFDATTVTDTSGKQHLAFNSSTSAFQLEAGDQMSNALLGNIGPSGTTGQSLTNTVQGAGNYVAGATAAAARKIIVRIQGGGLDGPEDLTLDVAAGATASTVLADLQTQMANDANLQSAGIQLTGAALGSPLAFTSNSGEQFQVATTGDADNLLGMGTFSSGAGASNFDQSSITGSTTTFAAAPTQFSISIGGGTPIATTSFTPAAADETSVLAAINNEFKGNAAFQAADLQAVDSGGHIEIQSGNGTSFRIAVTTDGATLGFDKTAASSVSQSSQSAITSNATIDAGGTTQTNAGAAGNDVFYFGAIANGSVNQAVSDKQAITLTAPDADGIQHGVTVNLDNTNARSLDEALATINAQLQQSNIPALQHIVAVEEQGSSTGSTLEGIRFISTQSFEVIVGGTATGSASNLVGLAENTATGSPNYVQGSGYAGAVSGTGSTAEITNPGSAQAALNALQNAATALGGAQAAVGTGETQFNFVVNVAQSQLTNLAAGESTIRDADLAAEAANLTKAQILMQSGMAALSQANSERQQVLTLFRG